MTTFGLKIKKGWTYYERIAPGVKTINRARVDIKVVQHATDPAPEGKALVVTQHGAVVEIDQNGIG